MQRTFCFFRLFEIRYSNDRLKRGLNWGTIESSKHEQKEQEWEVEIMNDERMKKIHRREFRIWFKDHGKRGKSSLDLIIRRHRSSCRVTRTLPAWSLEVISSCRAATTDYWISRTNTSHHRHSHRHRFNPLWSWTPGGWTYQRVIDKAWIKDDLVILYLIF